MSSRQEHEVNAAGMSEKDVVEYLQRHPKFFEAHLDLLTELRLPHHSGRAVSLIERQVSVLREQRQELERKLHNLIQIARDNDKLNRRMQKLALALMETESLEDVFYTLQDILRNDFNADSIVLRIFSSEEAGIPVDNVRFVDRRDPALKVFDKFFASRKPICGALNRDQSQYLFGDQADEMTSASLVPVCDGDCFGLLAIGSHDPKRFHPAMGTVFLSFMGEMVGRTIARFIRRSDAEQA